MLDLQGPENLIGLSKKLLSCGATKTDSPEEHATSQAFLNA